VAEPIFSSVAAISRVENDSDRFIICMKWGSKYGPEYVNRLRGMVLRNLSKSVQLICLTDNATGVHPDVECIPIPSLDLPSQLPERGWKKLTVFASALGNLKGTALFLDLDVVIVNSLEPFFEHPGSFVIIHDYKRPWRITGNSSVFRFELGAYPDLLTNFKGNQEAIRKRFRNEQAFLSAYIHEHGTLTYWPRSWCPSFKYNSIPNWPTNYWRAPVIPNESRIVIFHGECNPPDALAGRRNRWLRFIKPTRWISTYWTE
jgi:hypothetical protein